MAATHFCSLDSDTLRVTAELILKNHHSDLPDLGQVTVLLPDLRSAHHLHHHLLALSNCSALILPTTTTLHEAVSDTHEYALLNTSQLEHMLAEALQQDTNDKRFTNRWHLIQSMIEMFRELDLSLPLTQNKPDVGKLQAQLENTGQLNKDTYTVLTLWEAWHQQLSDEHKTTLHHCYIRGLANWVPTTPTYMVNYEWLYPRELACVTQQLQTDNFYVIGHTASVLYEQLEKIENTPTSDFLQNLFTPKEFFGSKLFPITQSLSNKLNIIESDSFSDEAATVTRQVKTWKKNGIKKIAIITNDKKLARRISLLANTQTLESFNPSGWILSTTHAAGLLISWLSCLGNDFPYVELENLLKNKYWPTNQSEHYQLANIIKKQLVIIEKQLHSLTKLQDLLPTIHKRIDTQTYDTLNALFTGLQKAANPILEMQNKKHLLSTWLDALIQSLDTLELKDELLLDAAGRKLIHLLIEHQQASTGRTINLSFQQFDQWLRRELEKQTFVEQVDKPDVTILSLNESAHWQGEAAILCGASQQYLPSIKQDFQFFHDDLRHILRIKPRAILTQLQRQQFCQLIRRTPAVTITYVNNEETQRSNWVAILSDYHQMVFNDNLIRSIGNNSSLHSSANTEDVILPTGVIHNNELSSRMSASAHQALIDCPYRYYLQYHLRLQSPEDISAQLSASDVGNVVHQCLQDFHQQLLKKNVSISADNRLECMKLFESISEKIWREHRTDSLNDSYFIKQWQTFIQHYVDWHLANRSDYAVDQCEQTLQIKLPRSGVSLDGKLDRIDRSADGYSIIDYKTGSNVASTVSVKRGESVQLLSYAISFDKPVDILNLTINLKVSPVELAVKNWIKEDDATELSQLAKTRLDDILVRIQTGEALPATPDKDKCERCQVNSICRPQSWV